MLGIRVSCAGRYPTVNDISDLLSGMLGVVGLVHLFSILPSSAVRDLVQVDSFVSELRQEFCHEHNGCDVPGRDQVEFTTMSQLSKPEVVGLLIQQSCHRQVQRITPFDVQLLSKCRLTDAAWESQTVDFLVVVVVFILLPVRIGIKPVGTGGFMVFWTSG